MISNDTPAGRIVSIFGGQTAMQRATGFRQSTIWSWLKARTIPQKHWPRIVVAASKLPDPRILTAADFVELPAPVPQSAEAA